MPDIIRATSTTDTVDQMRAALGMLPVAEAVAEVEAQPDTPDAGLEGEAESEGTEIDPETAPPAVNTDPDRTDPQHPRAVSTRQQYRPAKARIAQLTAQKAESDERAAALAAENATLKAQLEGKTTPPAPAAIVPPVVPAVVPPVAAPPVTDPAAVVPPVAAPVVPPVAPPIAAAADEDAPYVPDPNDKKPNQDDYEEFGDYIDNLTRWNARQLIAEDRHKQTQIAARAQREANIKAQQDAHAQREQAYVATYNERAAKARERHPDFDDAMAAGGQLLVPNTVIHHMKQSPLGAELQYYLVMHPDEANAINDLHQTDPIAAMVAFGAVEVKVKAELSEPVKPRKIPSVPVSSAPAPQTRVGSGTVVVAPDIETMSQKDYNDLRDREEAERRRSA
jgi:hypothetical protein